MQKYIMEIKHKFVKLPRIQNNRIANILREQ